MPALSVKLPQVAAQDVVAGVAAVAVDVGPGWPNWSRSYPVFGARPLTSSRPTRARAVPAAAGVAAGAVVVVDVSELEVARASRLGVADVGATAGVLEPEVLGVARPGASVDIARPTVDARRTAPQIRATLTSLLRGVRTAPARRRRRSEACVRG